MINPFLNSTCFDNSFKTLIVRPYALAIQNIKRGWKLTPQSSDSLPIKSFCLRKVTYYAVGVIFLIPVINTIALITLRSFFSRSSPCRLYVDDDKEPSVQDNHRATLTLTSLPRDLRKYIFSYLEAREAAQSSAVSRIFYISIHSSQLWKEFCAVAHRRWNRYYSLNPKILELRANDLQGDKNWKVFYLQYDRMRLRKHELLVFAEAAKYIAATSQGTYFSTPPQRTALFFVRQTRGEILFECEVSPIDNVTIDYITYMLPAIPSR